MKKNILILCSLLAITSMNAMNKRSGQNDDNDKDTLPTIGELSLAINDATLELIKLRIKASVLEQSIRKVPAMKDVNFRNGLSMAPAPEARTLHREIIKKKLAQQKHDPKIIDDCEAHYLNATMHLFDLGHEAMVLSQLEEELKSHMAIIAKSSKQQAAPAAEASQPSDH